MFVAQTNIQLYNQLRGQERSLGDLQRVQSAYEFMTTLYGSHFQSDGKPFLSHVIGVASIVSHFDAPIDVVLAALAHNVYGNGDFGDGLTGAMTARRRSMMVAALGQAVEALVRRFPDYRITTDTIDVISARLDAFTETERHLILIDLADYLEKYVDLGVLYYGQDRWAREIVEGHGTRLCKIARRLDYPGLSASLSKAFKIVEADEKLLGGRLRTSDGRRHLKLIVPRSCRRRVVPYLMSRLQTWGRRARAAMTRSSGP